MIRVLPLDYKRGGFTLSAHELNVCSGERIALIGENGSGKSTLLHLMCGIIDGAKVEYSGKDINAIGYKERAKLTAFMPQMPSVVFPFSVFEVVRLGAYACGSISRADKQTDETIKRAGIEHLKDRSFSELSGGEKRRVMIARTLNQATPVIFLDEPVSMLDVRHSLEILELLCGSGKTLIASMHEVNLAVKYFDRVWMMKDGKLLYDISSKEVKAEMMSEVFNVKAHSCNDHYTFSI